MADSRGTRCPTCNSPAPNRFPATAFEGEALGCPDGWHLTDPSHPPSETDRALVERARASSGGEGRELREAVATAVERMAGPLGRARSRALDGVSDVDQMRDLGLVADGMKELRAALAGGEKVDRCPTCKSRSPLFTNCIDGAQAEAEGHADFPRGVGCGNPWHDQDATLSNQPERRAGGSDG